MLLQIYIHHTLSPTFFLTTSQSVFLVFDEIGTGTMIVIVLRCTPNPSTILILLSRLLCYQNMNVDQKYL